MGIMDFDEFQDVSYMLDKPIIKKDKKPKVKYCRKHRVEKSKYLNDKGEVVLCHICNGIKQRRRTLRKAKKELQGLIRKRSKEIRRLRIKLDKNYSKETIDEELRKYEEYEMKRESSIGLSSISNQKILRHEVNTEC